MAKGDTHKKARVKTGKGSTPRFSADKLAKNYPECIYDGCFRLKQKSCVYCPTHAGLAVDEMIERTKNDRDNKQSQSSWVVVIVCLTGDDSGNQGD